MALPSSCGCRNLALTLHFELLTGFIVAINKTYNLLYYTIYFKNKLNICKEYFLLGLNNNCSDRTNDKPTWSPLFWLAGWCLMVGNPALSNVKENQAFIILGLSLKGFNHMTYSWQMLMFFNDWEFFDNFYCLMLKRGKKERKTAIIFTKCLTFCSLQ